MDGKTALQLAWNEAAAVEWPFHREKAALDDVWDLQKPANRSRTAGSAILKASEQGFQQGEFCA
jgi:hypothetical protein